VAYNTHCVVFLLCLFSSCVPCVASFSGLSIFLLPLRYSLTFIYHLLASSIVLNSLFVIPNSLIDIHYFVFCNSSSFIIIFLLS
jgi:hypothetical protein